MVYNPPHPVMTGGPSLIVCVNVYVEYSLCMTGSTLIFFSMVDILPVQEICIHYSQ